MASSPNYPGVPQSGSVAFNNADGTGSQTIFTAATTSGSAVIALTALATSSSGTSTVANFNLEIQHGGSGDFFLVDILNVPARGAIADQGFDAFTRTTLLARNNKDGQMWWQLAPDDVVQITPRAAVTSGETVTFTLSAVSLA